MLWAKFINIVGFFQLWAETKIRHRQFILEMFHTVVVGIACQRQFSFDPNAARLSLRIQYRGAFPPRTVYVNWRDFLIMSLTTYADFEEILIPRIVLYHMSTLIFTFTQTEIPVKWKIYFIFNVPITRFIMECVF